MVCHRLTGAGVGRKQSTVVRDKRESDAFALAAKMNVR
jgi:hypothetical protein